jgi:hypothetical protein
MEEKIPTYYITIDPQYAENDEWLGISQIAYTPTPAIEVMGLAFNAVKQLRFIDELKGIVAAPALQPDTPIARYDNEMGYYNVVFTEDDILMMVEMFNRDIKSNQFNLDHDSNKVAPAFMLYNWIIEDPETDLSLTKYGVKGLKKGSWFTVSKFTDMDFFKSEIIEGGRNGLSVEGIFALALKQIKQKYNKQEFESYTDYPKQATENAKIALRWAEENGWGDCGTPVGKARANQLAKGEAISRDTIARMASFARHRENSDKELGDGCGRLMWLAWGGDAGIEWAQRKLEQIDNEKFEVFVVEPNAGETEDEFISRCIKEEINSGYPQDQAAAICYSKWENKNYNKQNKKNEMKLKFEKAMLADGTPIYVSALEVGGKVKVMDENGESVPVFDAEHVLSNGDVVVTVGGEITEIKPKVEAEEMAEVEETVEETVEEMAEEVVEVPVVEAPAEDLKSYIDAKINDLLSIIAELKSEIENKDVEEDEIIQPMDASKNKAQSLSAYFSAMKRR